MSREKYGLNRRIKRGAKGHFLPGTAPGPGRPRREIERDFIRATIENCPRSRWVKIVAKTVEMAEEGDAAARTWLGRILLGEERTPIRDTLTGPELQEIDSDWRAQCAPLPKGPGPVIVRRDAGGDLEFVGVLLGSAGADGEFGHSRTLKLYLADDGKYILAIIDDSTLLGEADRHDAIIFATKKELLAHFTKGNGSVMRPGKELLRSAGLGNLVTAPLLAGAAETAAQVADRDRYTLRDPAVREGIRRALDDFRKKHD